MDSHSSPALRRGFRLGLCVALTLASAGCAKLKARDSLNKGVQAYKSGRYELAIENFKTAKQLDPLLMNARLYLATAYATQYIPGAPSPDNKRNGEAAIAEFQEVLQIDQKNLNAIDGIASIMFNMAGTPPMDVKKFEEARSWHDKHLSFSPNDPQPHYSIGVIEWTLSYAGNKKARAEYNASARKQIKDDEPMAKPVREKFVADHGKNVDNGIEHLKKAMQLQPDYEDAMAYLNLLYRQKADMVEAKAEREDYLKQADDLVDKVKAVKQKKMEAAEKAPPKE
ncbi:MAG: hypothetical protein HY046_02355 [Acidobacteria bacterium]|nr:hypothetical protein [Acidobacteriota bacterium]